MTTTISFSPVDATRFIDPPLAIWLPRVSAKPNRARIKMPYARGTRLWLRDICGYGTRPEFERNPDGGGVWTVSRVHFDKVATALAERYGEVVCFQDFTETVICHEGCQNAGSPVSHCECSCLGMHHGNNGQGIGSSAEWTNGTIYAYHDFTRRAWIRKAKPEAERKKIEGQLAYDELMRFMANEVDYDGRRWRRDFRSRPIYAPIPPPVVETEAAHW